MTDDEVLTRCCVCGLESGKAAALCSMVEILADGTILEPDDGVCVPGVYPDGREAVLCAGHTDEAKATAWALARPFLTAGEPWRFDAAG